jgi:hypothetical protein
LRVLLPIAAVAVAGLLFVQFGLDALGLGPDTGEPVAASAVGSASPSATPQETPETLGQTGTTGAPEQAPAEQPSSEPVEESGGMTQLEAELETHKVVVLVVYSPEGAVDSLVTSEARLGASDVNAGFVAVNAQKEKLIGDLALEYDLRETPAVLIFRRGPELKTKLVGYADRQTVAQAAQDARRA